MKYDVVRCVISIINISILLLMIFGIFKLVKGHRNSAKKHSDIEEKMNKILAKLDSKENLWWKENMD